MEEGATIAIATASRSRKEKQKLIIKWKGSGETKNLFAGEKASTIPLLSVG